MDEINPMPRAGYCDIERRLARISCVRASLERLEAKVPSDTAAISSMSTWSIR
jgi:hypothetical protein